jgi:hypothetical protein
MLLRNQTAYRHHQQAYHRLISYSISKSDSLFPRARFQVLTVVKFHIATCDIILHSLVCYYQHFGEYTASIFRPETLATIYKTTGVNVFMVTDFRFPRWFNADVHPALVQSYHVEEHAASIVRIGPEEGSRMFLLNFGKQPTSTWCKCPRAESTSTILIYVF